VDSPKRVYVDFDDVLSETARAITEVVAERFDKRVPFEDLKHYDLDKSFGLTRPELADLMGLLHQPEMLSAMAVVDSAAAVLDEWTRQGCSICVVTGRPPSSVKASLEWLGRNGIGFEEVIFVDKYGRSPDTHGGIRAWSLDELKRESFCLAVEDSPDMADFLADTMGVPVALLDQPWNAGRCAAAEAGGRLVRCFGWDEVKKRFPSPGAAQGIPAGAACA